MESRRMIAATTIVVSAICCKEGAMALENTVLAIDYSCLPHQNLERNLPKPGFKSRSM